MRRGIKMKPKKIICPECKNEAIKLMDTQKKIYDCSVCRCLFSKKNDSSVIIEHGTTYKK